jgi:hypothetical protein
VSFIDQSPKFLAMLESVSIHGIAGSAPIPPGDTRWDSVLLMFKSNSPNSPVPQPFSAEVQETIQQFIILYKFYKILQNKCNTARQGQSH